MVAPNIAISTRASGVWRRIDQPRVKVAGVWRDVKKVSTKVGGTWVETFVDAANEISIGTQNISAFDSSTPNPSSTATYILRVSGVARAERSPGSSNDIAGQWKAFQYQRSFEVLWNSVSGSSGVFTAPTQNSWLALSTERSWSLTNTSEQTSASRVFDVSIREVGTTVTLDTARISLTAENLP